MRDTDTMYDTPSDADRQEDLVRQYGNLRADPATKIFCPWCSKINIPDQPPCCQFFAEGVAKIGQDQLKSVIKQLKEVRLGSRRGILCPYCGKYCIKGEHPADWARPMVDPFCCDNLHDAALAIAQRETVQRQIEHKKRVEDNLCTAAKN